MFFFGCFNNSTIDRFSLDTKLQLNYFKAIKLANYPATGNKTLVNFAEARNIHSKTEKYAVKPVKGLNDPSKMRTSILGEVQCFGHHILRFMDLLCASTCNDLNNGPY